MSASTIVIADDDHGVREALSALIVAHPDLELIGVGASGFQAVELCASLRPAVAIVDVMMPGGGPVAVAGIRQASPLTAVVVYTARSDRRTKERMLAAGATLVVVKGRGDDLASEVARVALGKGPAALEGGVIDG